MRAQISPEQRTGPAAYPWFSAGDLNGFFGLMFDNLTVLSFMAGILIFSFHFPAEIVYKRMFPGTAFGVLFGDLVFTVMAFRLAKRTGDSTVTAMPLGLDTPSSIGMTLVVLGPAFVTMKARGMSPDDAGLATWHLGMATMVLIGIVKIVFSFIGGWIQKVVPLAGLLGSLAGIALALMGLLPLVDIFSMPLIGVLALGIVLYTFLGQGRLPFNIPGVLAAVILGTGLYYLLGPAGLIGQSYAAPAAQLHFGLPLPTLAFLHGLRPALQYLPISIPFALVTIIGGINNTESARVAGDTYDTRSILLTEAFATLIAGLCGGVAQTTPYIGHPAYKRMGSRAGYTLLTGLFVGLGGMLGYVGYMVELLPRAVLGSILVFVALEITRQAFLASPARHAPAVALSYLPSLAALVQIKLTNPDLVPAANFAAALTARGQGLPELLVIIALGNGFIVTAMLWAGFLAEMIDGRMIRSAIYLLLLATFSLFGIVHSALPEGSMYLPWTLPTPARLVPYQFATAYLVLAAVIFGLSFASTPRRGAASDH
jgi:adenine/guanine/hypoxanthine permease